MKYPDARILIFCKAPIPGRVKTRLSPELTPQAAAALHRELATRLITEVINARLAPTILYCEPDCEDAFFKQFAADLTRVPQQGAGLGERMANAFAETGAEAPRPMILIGTDCPNLDAAYLDRAMALLESHDAVIGPAEDGGYGLIGLHRPQQQVFDGIRWGGADVCAQTCRRLNAQRLQYALLPLLWDVDRPADVARYQASLGSS